MKQDNELGLRISAKYNRIYIHRTTLKAMGDPAFVSLGIHPQSKSWWCGSKGGNSGCAACPVLGG